MSRQQAHLRAQAQGRSSSRSGSSASCPSPEESLAIYLNHVFLGATAYGVAAAAETYFGKDVGDVTIAEAALLAGLVAAPTDYAPHLHYDLARNRQRYVLARMREDGNTQLAEALDRPESRSSAPSQSTISPRPTS